MSIQLAGTGLFSGAATAITLECGAGPTTVRAFGETVAFPDFRPGRSTLSSTLRLPGGQELRTVEHFFAAIAGARAYEGLRVTVAGPELPLLDGTAAPFAAAIAGLGLPPSAPQTRITRAFTVAVEDSTYTFEPAEETRITSTLVTDDARLVGTVSFAGDLADFRARIAPARTFAFARDLDAYAARGVAAHLEATHFVVIGPEILSAGAPFTADEPARHKLLDLLGDLVLHGGLPQGRLTAERPGHARTHEALARARAAGVLAPA